MSFKTTIVIAILLALLGGYAYWFEYKGGQRKEEAKEKEKTLFEIKKEDVTQIEIEGISTQPVVIVRAGKEDWKLTQPIQTKADQSTVDRILSNSEKVKFREIIEEQPKDLKPYELDQPKMTIRISLKGNTRKAVSIGAKNPVDNVYYIRVENDPRIYLTDSSLGDLANTTLMDLRDKKLTDFNAEKVESLGLKTTDMEIRFAKQNAVWKITNPVKSPASDSEVTSLISTLESLRATRFVDNPAPELKEYALDKPSVSVELVLEKGLRQRIDCGKTSDETYCRIEGNPAIAAVGDALNTIFEKNLEDWREKKALVFNRFDVEELRARLGGQEYVFIKGTEEKWNQLSPVKGEVEYDQIQAVLEKLEAAEISKYGEQTSLPGPAVAEVFVTLKDWQEKTTKKHLAFGAVADNAQAVKNDDYEPIIYVAPTVLQEFHKAATEIKSKTPAPPAKKP